MVTTVIYMLLRRVWHLFKICHVLTFVSAHFYCKICFKVSKYWLSREKVWHNLWACIVHIYCAARLVDSAELSSTVLWCYGHIFVQFFFRVCHSFTSRKLYICTETSISCINLIKLMYLHFPNFVFFKWTMTDMAIVRSHIIIKRKRICAYYLFLVDSIKLMLGACQKWFTRS